MAKVFIVNPANASIGFAFITPRWLYVIAGATPTELVGEPIVIDEPVAPFKPEAVRRGDIEHRELPAGLPRNPCREGTRSNGDRRWHPCHALPRRGVANGS